MLNLSTPDQINSSILKFKVINTGCKADKVLSAEQKEACFPANFNINVF